MPTSIFRGDWQVFLQKKVSILTMIKFTHFCLHINLFICTEEVSRYDNMVSFLYVYYICPISVLRETVNWHQKSRIGVLTFQLPTYNPPGQSFHLWKLSSIIKNKPQTTLSSLICGVYKGQTQRNRAEWWFPGCEGGGNGKLLCKGEDSQL